MAIVEPLSPVMAGYSSRGLRVLSGAVALAELAGPGVSAIGHGGRRGHGAVAAAIVAVAIVAVAIVAVAIVAVAIVAVAIVAIVAVAIVAIVAVAIVAVATLSATDQRPGE